MAIRENWRVAGYELSTARSKSARETRTGARLGILKLLRLWRARHRHRRELAMMSKRDLKDARVALDLAAYEARKWPWQKWNPQWSELDEVLLRANRGPPPRQ